MLIKAHAPHVPLQGPVLDTSGIGQPPATPGTAQDPNTGTSHVTTH